MSYGEPLRAFAGLEDEMRPAGVDIVDVASMDVDEPDAALLTVVGADSMDNDTVVLSEEVVPVKKSGINKVGMPMKVCELWSDDWLERPSRESGAVVGSTDFVTVLVIDRDILV